MLKPGRPLFCLAGGVLVALLSLTGYAQQTSPLTQGMLIDRSITIRPVEYRLADYEAGILARSSPDLHLTGDDLSCNWNQRRSSGIEKDERLRGGARLWVDNNLVIDAWDPHESRVDRTDITGGRTRLKPEYHETAGWAEIGLQIQPRRSRK